MSRGGFVGSISSTMAYCPFHQRWKSTSRQRSLQKGTNDFSPGLTVGNSRWQIGHVLRRIMGANQSPFDLPLDFDSPLGFDSDFDSLLDELGLSASALFL